MSLGTTIGAIWGGPPPNPAREQAERLRAAALRHGATEIPARELEPEQPGRYCAHFRRGDTRVVRHDAVVNLAGGPVPEFFLTHEEAGVLVWFDLAPGRKTP